MIDGGLLVLQAVKAVTGFILGLLGAAGFLAFGFFRDVFALQDPVMAGAVTGTALVSAAFLGALAFAPSFIAIALAEILRLRSAVYHVGLAGVIAAGLWIMGDSAMISNGHAGWLPGTTVALAAGFVGGIIYWLIAGRTSGCWRSPADRSG
ncbi:translation initiation factor IF-3 [Pannonibacter sp. Pt2-lr]|uniref:Translation initiation factor IF-3 n=1 Tax=Pannonibacter anstelovis TaxID=3121537 RepID=A0ABU7ZRW4_9HYPH